MRELLTIEKGLAKKTETISFVAFLDDPRSKEPVY